MYRERALAGLLFLLLVAVVSARGGLRDLVLDMTEIDDRIAEAVFRQSRSAALE